MHRVVVYLWLIVLSSLSVFPYIVKIGNEEISKKDFQDFIDVQKFIDNQDSFEDLVKKKKTTKNGVLTDYIDQLIVVREAVKKGYTKKNPDVAKAYEEKKQRWVTTLYVAKNVDIDSVSVNEDDMQKTYNELPQQSRPKPYSQLTDQEKQGLYQIAIIKVAQEKKKVFQKVLEKKYSTKRFKDDQKVVAQVEGKKITKDDLQAKITEQLARLGISEKDIKDRDPKRFQEAKQDILDELIFEILVGIDIEKSGFLKNRLITKAYDFLLNQVISEQFILNEVASKFTISAKDLDQAFVQVSRQDPSIKNMLPTEQERVLKNFIIQSKIPEIVKDYLVEVKEGILIRRNKEELESIT